MRKRALMIVLLGVAMAGAVGPVAAVGSTVARLAGFDTVVIVAMPEDFPVGSLMRAHCSALVRVERPDGSAIERQHCQLSDEPVMIPAFQGAAPDRAFIRTGGSCSWTSDYWYITEGIDVAAQSVRSIVTPSGHVFVESEYPAEPLVCE
jgi:hypothetical protein